MDQFAPVPPKPLFPLPTAEIYGLEGMDAVLFNAAAQFYSWRGGSNSLLLPALTLLDTYELDEHTTCYVCLFREFDYYDLDQGLDDLDHPNYVPSFGALLSRFIVVSDDEGIPQTVEIEEQGDGEGWRRSIQNICGPNQVLATALIEGLELPVEERDIPSRDPIAMLDRYIEYTYRSSQPPPESPP